MFETIVALATPPMKGALGIVRLSGDDCFEIVSKVFSKSLLKIDKRTLLVGSIASEGEKIDDVVLAAYKGPKSFTGEDSVEIICHGSLLIANQIIAALLKTGARMATNGEFSSRAFLHHKIDLIQAESINDLINSTTNESKKISTMSLDGKVSTVVKEIKKLIADLLSLIEVNIDYPEYEDIEVANKEKIVADIDYIDEKLKEMIADGEKAKIVKEGLNVAIVGKPNVGKSSLLNALLGHEKAIVTDIAGTTRDVVEGEFNLKGVVVRLLDTAGIRESSDVVESIGVERSKKTIEEADIVIVVLDGSKDIDSQDQEILNITKDSKRIVVYNKSDVAPRENALQISALNKDIQPLLDELCSVIGIEDDVFSKPALNNARQIGLLKQAKNSLDKAKEDALADLPIELIAVSLNSAYSSILEILGESNQTDFSQEIFSRFCVGK